MTCPDCGYMMTALDAKCSRCARYPHGRKCDGCGMYNYEGQPLCRVCVDAEWEQEADRQQVLQQEANQRATTLAAAAPPIYTERGPRAGSISFMWILSGLAWIMFLSGAYAFGYIVDIIAVVIAFTLIGSRCSIDRTNAGIKLSLEGAAFVIGFISAFSNTHR